MRKRIVLFICSILAGFFLFVVGFLCCLKWVNGVLDTPDIGVGPHYANAKILSISKPIEAPGKSSWKIEKKGNDWKLTIDDFFYRENSFEKPSVSSSRDNQATLRIQSKPQLLFQTKSEYFLHLEIMIPGKWLEKGETIYFLNGDYSVVVGQQTI